MFYPAISLQHIFGGRNRFAMQKLFVLVTAVDPMVLGLVRCPAKVHFTAVFALRNGKFSGLGGDSPPYPYLSFVPGYASF